MKKVQIQSNVVKEVIPDYALPVERWYGPAFAEQCVDAPEEVEQGWVYDPYTGNFAPTGPEPIPEPTTEDRVKTLEAQLEASIQSNALLEECLVEMAGIVYA